MFGKTYGSIVLHHTPYTPQKEAAEHLKPILKPILKDLKGKKPK